MRKTKSVSIEGNAYELTQMGAVEGRELVVLFSQMFGRVFGKVAPFLGVIAKPAAEAQSADSEAVLAIAEAINMVSPSQLEPLWDAFSKNAWVRGKDGKSRECVKDVFDDHFAGEYFAMTMFFVESAKLNFADFLAKAFAQANASQGTDPTS